MQALCAVCSVQCTLPAKLSTSEQVKHSVDKITWYVSKTGPRMHLSRIGTNSCWSSKIFVNIFRNICEYFQKYLWIFGWIEKPSAAASHKNSLKGSLCCCFCILNYIFEGCLSYWRFPHHCCLGVQSPDCFRSFGWWWPRPPKDISYVTLTLHTLSFQPRLEINC